jgi:hypothetical protein
MHPNQADIIIGNLPINFFYKCFLSKLWDVSQILKRGKMIRRIEDFNNIKKS